MRYFVLLIPGFNGVLLMHLWISPLFFSMTLMSLYIPMKHLDLCLYESNSNHM